MAPEPPTPSTTGRKPPRTAGVKKTSSTPPAALTVTASKDLNKIFEMLSMLDAKVQAIGEMLEKELSPTAAEQNPAPPPLPLRQAFDTFTEMYTK